MISKIFIHFQIIFSSPPAVGIFLRVLFLSYPFFKLKIPLCYPKILIAGSLIIIKTLLIAKYDIESCVSRPKKSEHREKITRKMIALRLPKVAVKT